MGGLYALDTYSEHAGRGFHGRHNPSQLHSNGDAPGANVRNLEGLEDKLHIEIGNLVANVATLTTSIAQREHQQKGFPLAGPLINSLGAPPYVNNDESPLDAYLSGVLPIKEFRLILAERSPQERASIASQRKESIDNIEKSLARVESERLIFEANMEEYDDFDVPVEPLLLADCILREDSEALALLRLKARVTDMIAEPWEEPQREVKPAAVPHQHGNNDIKRRPIRFNRAPPPPPRQTATPPVVAPSGQPQSYRDIQTSRRLLPPGNRTAPFSGRPVDTRQPMARSLVRQVPRQPVT